MNEPPAALLRLTHLLEGGPPRAPSKGLCWFLIVVGVVEIALFGGPLFLMGSNDERTLSSLLFLTVGLFLAAQGVAGLLKERRAGLSRWFLVLQALLLLPLILLGGAQFYAWAGLVGAGGYATLAVAIFVWDWARRRRARR